LENHPQLVMPLVKLFSIELLLSLWKESLYSLHIPVAIFWMLLIER